VSNRQIRALRLVEHGAPLQMQQVALQEPGPDEVVIELAAAGVNPVDGYGARGIVAQDGPLPRTLGAEGSGWWRGAPVTFVGGGLGTMRDGTWAEAVVVHRDNVIALDPRVDLTAAAALAIVGLTAWNTVSEVARVRAGDRVLVLGGGGGAGLSIISLALAAGATVVGQAGSEPKAAAIRDFGAEAVVADASNLVGQLGDFSPTVTFDPLGGDFTPAALSVLAPGGRHVLFGTSAGTQAQLELRALYRAGQRILGYGGLRLTDAERVTGGRAAAAALADGRLRIHVGRLLPLSSAADESGGVLDALSDRSITGKLIIDCTS
jgi:NADPH2:quinone reductase